MKFHFVTLFPELIAPWLTTGVIGRALGKSFTFETYSLRDFTHNTRADDVAYGGGGGMVLRVEPLVRAVEHIRAKSPDSAVILFAAQGIRLRTELIEELRTKVPQELILICGRYEGIDQRFIEGWADYIISIGDFVVSGGELPALVFADSLIRFCEGTLDSNRLKEESFSIVRNGKRFLEYPHYTRPREFRGKTVPEPLLSGDHQLIEQWRLEASIRQTDGEINQRE